MLKAIHLYPQPKFNRDQNRTCEVLEQLRTHGQWSRKSEYIGMTRDDYMRHLATRVSVRHQICNDRGQLVGFWDKRDLRKYSTENDRITFKKPIMNEQDLLHVA